MELHNMEKLETHLFSSGSRGFLLTRVVVPKYTENGAPSSGIFKDEFKSLDPPNAILCSAKTALRRRCGFTPTRRLERGTFQKEIPRLAGGDVGQRLWERGQDVSCAVFQCLWVVGTAEAVGETCRLRARRTNSFPFHRL